MFKPTDERYVPWSEDFTTGYEHMHRYALAKYYTQGKRVLDLACGEGYGSWLLAQSAIEVIGVDIDEPIIHHATSVYQQDNLRFLQGSIVDIPIHQNRTFDLVTCFEALEHIVEHEALLSEVKRMLSKDGLFIVSTPNKPVYSNNGTKKNPHHRKELEFNEFDSLMRQHFKYVEFYGQKTYAASKIFRLGTEATNVHEYALKKDGHIKAFTDELDPHPRYFIAIGSDNKIPLIEEKSYLVDISNEPGRVKWVTHLPEGDPFMSLSVYGILKKLVKKCLQECRLIPTINKNLTT